MDDVKEIKDIISALVYLEKSIDYCSPEVVRAAYNSGRLMEGMLRKKDALSRSERAALIGRASNVIRKFENNCSCVLKEK